MNETRQSLLLRAQTGEESAWKDLTKAIDLAAPPSAMMAISPQQAKLLANAHTQRATLLHTTSKYLQTAKDNGELSSVTLDEHSRIEAIEGSV